MQIYHLPFYNHMTFVILRGQYRMIYIMFCFDRE